MRRTGVERPPAKSTCQGYILQSRVKNEGRYEEEDRDGGKTWGIGFDGEEYKGGGNDEN